MSKSWPAIEVRFPAVGGEEAAVLRDRLAVALDDLRPVAIEEADTAWRVFFADEADRDAALRFLPGSLPDAVEAVRLDVPDEDWARRSQQSLGAVRVGRIIVSPPWLHAPPGEQGREDVVAVTILPSMGFGTGHHASTRLCLSLLQDLRLEGSRVLDVGTGSAVLALAAWRLGAASIVAVDDDEDAIAAARDNVELNRAEHAVSLRHGDFRLMPGLSADVVLANLTGALLLRQAGTLAAAVAPGGSLIASGLTLEEEGPIVSALGLLLAPATRLAEDEWVGLRFDRPAR
jgi:ribosomal protein L11 methyltransferase